MSVEFIATIGTGAMILVGVAGTILPLLPGLLLVWSAFVLYGFVVGFDLAGVVATLLATMLLGLGLYLNVRIPQRSASAEGLSIPDQILSLVAGIGTAIVIPIIGFPVGFIGAIFIQRARRTGDASQAWISTRNTLFALLRGSAAQAICAFAMFVVWIVWAATVVTRG